MAHAAPWLLGYGGSWALLGTQHEHFGEDRSDARGASPDAVETEYGELFIYSTEKADTSPYAAVHRSGSHFGQALVDLREDLAAEAGARALLWAESVLHYFGGIG